MGLLGDIVSWGAAPLVGVADIVTGGAASEALGAEHSPYALAEGVVEDVGEGVKGVVEGITGETAAEASQAAASTQAAAMMEQLNYLKEINKLPQQYREQALSELAGIFIGDEDAEAQQTRFIDMARQSPIYKAIMGTQEAGEEAIMRQAGRTGGLRSGNVQSALAKHAQGLEREALSTAYGQRVSGLQGLAGMQTGERDIAGIMGDIGGVRAAGIQGAAQAQQQGLQNLMNLGLMGASFFI